MDNSKQVFFHTLNQVVQVIPYESEDNMTEAESELLQNVLDKEEQISKNLVTAVFEDYKNFYDSIREMLGGLAGASEDEISDFLPVPATEDALAAHFDYFQLHFHGDPASKAGKFGISIEVPWNIKGVGVLFENDRILEVGVAGSAMP